MYKVIFLDDETITLRLLESAIDWQKYDIALCGTASDGAEGIELFRQVEPDIVITDIRMPNMDGIELARAIRQTKKRVKIVLLSAYAEFEYAQSAIAYQASEYLLKPLDEDKLEAAIARLVGELDRDQAISSTVENYHLEQAEKKLQQLLDQYRDRPDTASGSGIPGEILEAFVGVDTLILGLRVTEPREPQMHTDVEGIRLLFKERLGSGSAVVAISPVEFVVLANSSVLGGQLEEMLDALRRRAQPVVVGVSSISPASPTNLGGAYRNAEYALYDCFYDGGELCVYSGRDSFSHDMVVNFADFEQPIAELVEQGKPGELIARVQLQLADLFRRRVEPGLIFDFVYDVLNWVKIDVTKQYRPVVLTGIEIASRDRLRACATRVALAAYLDEYMRTIGEAVSNLLAEDSGYYIVKRAKEYTRQHYTDMDFSLEQVAEYVGVSKNHFSRVFHKVTGKKFWDYVTQLRMEKAKELLKQSNSSNYEICRAVGYESEFYFSRMFKRVVGVAAQQFRRI
jgi:two-component system response regulator YesN